MELSRLRISEKKQAVLHTMNVHCVEDLLTYYPFRYETLTVVPREQWQKDMKIVIEATIVTKARVIRFKGKQSVTNFKVVYQDEELQVSIFNRPWVSAFPVGKRITLIGRYDGSCRITAMQYNQKPLQEQLGIHPVYNLKEGITQKELEKYIDKAYALMKEAITDFIPPSLRQKYRLIERSQALLYIHHPYDENSLKQSLRHLKYEEFLKFQLAMRCIKDQESKLVKGQGKQFEREEVMRLKHTLAFELSEDQEKVIEEIMDDLASEKIMYRLLQGDVGCGKTVVAAFGMYACILAHKQAALMAPTEILAKQHTDNLRAMFKDMDIVVEGLYGSLPAQDKASILERLKTNEIDLLVGTHALFQEQVDFYDLGMVVADEQHRFGVEQRRRLLAKGDKVDFLLMSATPIPRTLALSLYGDMEVSSIHQLPKGRMPITTKLVASKSMAPILEEVLMYIDEGNQCYVVCPAIENNEDYKMRNVMDIYKGMQASIGRKYRIGLLHGRMSAQEKDQVMREFVDGTLQILVTTTVIEVGVDVKNANIMIIYDAHRFGLSQIHQLRGRVGRGDKAGYCYLLSDTKDMESKKRLQACEKTNDGFELARIDLELRGPGDILGTRQSGVPGFILGDVIQDANILEVAREDACAILKNIECEEYAPIRAYIQELKTATRLD